MIPFTQSDLAQLWLLDRGGGVLVPLYLRNAYSDSLGDFCIFFVSFTRFEQAYEHAPKCAGCCTRRQPSGLGLPQLVSGSTLGLLASIDVELCMIIPSSSSKNQ